MAKMTQMGLSAMCGNGCLTRNEHGREVIKNTGVFLLDAY